MNAGFYNSAIRMATGSVQDMEVFSENLANANMPGYKRLTTMHAPFSDTLDQQVERNAQDANSIKVDQSQGALQPTGQGTDFAINGDGFFVVSNGDRQFLTRNGHFTVTPDGYLVNSLGMRLQGTGGDLQIPRGSSALQVSVDGNLDLRAGEKSFGRLKVVAADMASLERAGNTLFSAPDQLEDASDCNVVSGHLEQSNTSVFEELTGMMTTLRNYEACQKMLRSVDDAENKMMSKLT